jgi:diaminopimelate decarboxylase
MGSSIILRSPENLEILSIEFLLPPRQGGVPPARMVLHGNNKSRAELALALEHGVMIVLDNWSDVRLVEQLLAEREQERQLQGNVNDEAPKQRLMLRFTPGIECHTHEYIRTGHSDSKFGFGPDQLEAALRHLSPRLNADSVLARAAVVAGLHCHIGSQIFELQPHTDLAGVCVLSR